jgi:hypothetical protein
MAKKEDKFLSIRIVKFLMKLTGFWPGESKTEERVLKGILSYTIFAIGLALWIETTEFFFFSIGDFYVSIKIYDTHAKRAKHYRLGKIVFVTAIEILRYVKQRNDF